LDEEDTGLEGTGRRTKTKEVKKIKERQRRGKMIESITELRKLVPLCHSDQRINQAVVMEYTVDFINFLERRLGQLEEERKQLLLTQQQQRKNRSRTYPIHFPGRDSGSYLEGELGKQTYRTGGLPNGYHQRNGTRLSLSGIGPDGTLVGQDSSRSNIGNHGNLGITRNNYFPVDNQMYDYRNSYHCVPVGEEPIGVLSEQAALDHPNWTCNVRPETVSKLINSGGIELHGAAVLPAGKTLVNYAPSRQVRAHFVRRKQEPLGSLIPPLSAEGDSNNLIQDFPNTAIGTGMLKMRNPPYKIDKLPPYHATPDVIRKPRSRTHSQLLSEQFSMPEEAHSQVVEEPKHANDSPSSRGGVSLATSTTAVLTVPMAPRAATAPNISLTCVPPSTSPIIASTTIPSSAPTVRVVQEVPTTKKTDSTAQEKSHSESQQVGQLDTSNTIPQSEEQNYQFPKKLHMTSFLPTTQGFTLNK